MTPTATLDDVEAGTFPTEEELEALFAEILLIELIEAEVGQALDLLLTTTYTPTAA